MSAPNVIDGATERGRSQQRSTVLRLLSKPEAVPLILLIIELAAFGTLRPLYLSPFNIGNVLDFTVELGLIALPTTLLMIAGEFDLSVGSVFGFSAVLMWTLINGVGLPLPLAFVIALAAAGALGFVNGWFVTRIGVSSFLVTLGTLLVVRGAALFLTQGFPQRTWNSAGSTLAAVISGEIRLGTFHIYMALFWFVLGALVFHYVLAETKAGNWILAAGGNPGSALARGVKVGRTKMALFVITAMMAGFAGIASSIRTAAANPNSGTGYELQVIAMVVIGGTSLMGGRGTIIGTVIGVFILRSMESGLVMIGVPGLAYKIFIGVIILAMVALQAWMERRQQARG